MNRIRNRNSSLHSFLLFVIIVLAGQLSFGQATTGTLKGSIRDPHGAFVPGATVTCRNQDTGVEPPGTTTNDDGAFVITNLLPGTYSLTVSASDFKRKVLSDIKVHLGRDTDVRIDIEIGLPEETVLVSANSAEVVETNSQISANFSSEKVRDLPSNAVGSGIDTLALTVPGVNAGIGTVNQNGTSLSVNGNRAMSNNFTINGMDNNDLSISGPSFHVGNDEIVQEFQIITNNFSAQYGRNQGAVINIVTKGGTNSFHGAAYEYHRNSSLLDAMTNIERRDPTRSKRDKFISNVFGGTLGGPVVKEKLFFFGSYQRAMQRENFTSRGSNLAILPSEFSRLEAAFPGNSVIQVLTHQSPFALNNFGTVRPRAGFGTDRVCISATPEINCVAGGDESGFFEAAVPEREFAAPYDQDELTGRLDWFLSRKDSATVSYLWQDSLFGNSISRWPPGYGQINGFTGDQHTNSKNFSGSYTRLFSTSVSNSAQVTFQKIGDDWGGGCSDPLEGCITSPSEIGETFTIINFPGLTGQVSGRRLQLIGPQPLWPQGRTAAVYQVSDKLSWIFGNHSLLFGVDVRYLKNTGAYLPFYNGLFSYSSPEEVANNTPHSVRINDGEPTLHFKQRDQFYFLQDDWKVLPNLTLNLGLRYEYSGQPLNLLHKISVERESDPSRAFFLQSLPLEARTVPAIPSDKNNFAPRLGFAWSPNFGNSRFSRLLFGKQFDTVIRGGYSIAYDPVFYNIMFNLSTSVPMSFLQILEQPNVIPLPANPTGSVVRQAASSILSRNATDPRTLARTQVSGDFHQPWIAQYSFGIQRQIGRDNVVEIRYVGNRQNDLFQTVNRNPHYATLYYGFTANVPGLGQTAFPSYRDLLPAGISAPDPESGRLIAGNHVIRSFENTGSGRYDGLQIRYNGRLLRDDLTVGASYTFSKTFDNATDLFGWGGSPVSQNPFDYESGERGLSELDRRNSLAIELLYALPFGKSQRGIVGKLTGGWQISGIYNLADGEPYTPLLVYNLWGLPPSMTYEDTAFANLFGGDTLKPFVGNINAPVTQVGISQVDAALIFGVPVTDPNGFLSFNELISGNVIGVSQNDVRYIFNGPGAARIFGTPFGNAPRNFERGPKLNNLNFAIFKTTNISERIKMQFRFEAYNFLNHPNWSLGVSEGAASPGSIYLYEAGSRFARNDEANLSSRRIQLGLRVTF